MSKLRVMSEINIAYALNLVRERMASSFAKLPVQNQKKSPRLVAVSKVKPVELIIEAYKNGQRHFGENYIQELVEKSKNATIQEECSEIKWHFIGNIQSNKVSKLLTASNLHMVETVHSVKLANLLNSGWKKLNVDKNLQVMIQVNTSGEENKNGVEPSEAASLASYIRTECSQLDLKGLMTIGALARSISLPPDKANEDFIRLIDCKKDICSKLTIDEDDLELSMGMSSDFEHAIELGSNSVRVGSTIFGERPKKNSAVKLS